MRPHFYEFWVLSMLTHLYRNFQLETFLIMVLRESCETNKEAGYNIPLSHINRVVVCSIFRSRPVEKPEVCQSRIIMVSSISINMTCLPLKRDQYLVFLVLVARTYQRNSEGLIGLDHSSVESVHNEPWSWSVANSVPLTGDSLAPPLDSDI